MIFAVITILAVLMFAMMMSMVAMGSMMVMPSPSRVRVAMVVKRKR